MLNKRLAITILGIVLALPMIPVAARAADEDFCHDYAEAALRQVHELHEIPYCDRDVRDWARWSDDFHRHFDWCRGVSREEADRERDIRSHHIEECRR